MRYANTLHYDLQWVNPERLRKLDDGSFAWKGERMKAIRLARLYERAGYPDYAERVESCATWLSFYVLGDRRSLQSANFCKLRLCPMCVARGARVRAQLLSKVMDAVQNEHKCQYIFLTLTIQNVPGDKLGEAMSQLTKGWARLLDQRPVKRAVQGWFRAIEITRHNKPGEWHGTYHPHIHAILAVEDGYFRRKNGLYLTKDDIIARWRKAMRLSYDPSVKINKTYDRKRKGAKPHSDDEASSGAVLEAAKYATKDSDYISDRLSDDEAVQIVKDYTSALYRRRLTAFGGWFKDVAARLKVPDFDNVDLTDGDDRIRADLAEMIEEYGWHVGAGDYVLADRFINPLRVKRDAGHEAGIQEGVTLDRNGGGEHGAE